MIQFKINGTISKKYFAPHPMEKVSSTVLMGVQSQLSDGRL